MNVDHGRLSRLREGQGEIANHVIDEYAAGHLSRRDFLRKGTVVGISIPVLGAIISACGSSSTPSSSSTTPAAAGQSGATIHVGIVVPTATINPLTVADQGGLDMLAQTGEHRLEHQLLVGQAQVLAGLRQHVQSALVGDSQRVDRGGRHDDADVDRGA